jgi:P-type Ca2+ transporter type 2C
MVKVRNSALWWVIRGAAAFRALVLAVPWARTVFRFSAVHADDVVICIVTGLLSVVFSELFKTTPFGRGLDGRVQLGAGRRTVARKGQ